MAHKITAFFFLLAFVLGPDAMLFSQITMTWKGGTPGKECQWQCPQNWTSNKVPDGFSNVVIPATVASGSLSNPVLNERTEVNSLRIEGDSRLKIGPQGMLTVYTEAFIPQERSIDVQGILILLNEHIENGTPVSRGRLAGILR